MTFKLFKNNLASSLCFRTSLCISSLQTLDEEAEGIAVSLTQCYARHVFRPIIDLEDLESDHVRRFLIFLRKEMIFIESDVLNYSNNTRSPQQANYIENLF